MCFGQAFLELSTEEAAITMVNYYSAVTPHVRNVPVFIQYSNHKELKTETNQVPSLVHKSKIRVCCYGISDEQCWCLLVSRVEIWMLSAIFAA